MALTELTSNLNIHQSHPDQPALTADELKEDFDKAGNLIKEYLNETLLPELNGIINSLQNKDSNIDGTINNLQRIVEEATTNITNIQTSISNINNSITSVQNKTNNYKSGANTKITIGSSVPSSLENGEVYFQYF